MSYESSKEKAYYCQQSVYAIVFQKKTADDFLTKISHVDNEWLLDNLDFEKIKTWDRLKSNTADPSHF